MAIFTQSPWVDRNDPLQYMREGAQLGLQERGQDLSAQEAGNRLRLSYDSLAQEREQARQAAFQRGQQTSAVLALKGAQQDAMTNYRNQQIEAQQARLAEAKDKATQAAAALNATHDDTAKFVADADKLGAAAALSKHPNADKVVVNHVMALEQAKEKAPKPVVQKGAIDFAAPGQDNTQNAASLTRFTGVPLDSPVINSVLGTNAPPGTGTNYVTRMNGTNQPPPPAMVAPAASQFKAGQKVVQDGIKYQFDGTNWNPVQ